jgi:spermidine/putrescine transport system ATP-binding protein
VTAVDVVSVSALPGEFLTLLGPSGCGKTTLLRMIAGFERPDAGRVILGGEDVTERPPYKRDVTTVFQHYALFPHLNVFDNVAFGLERRRVLDQEIKLRVGRALEMVRLGGLDQREPRELSGGQQQRVALARALVLEPRVLLLDEPLAALDLKLRKQMQLELKGLQQRLGISFIYVTHDQEEALTMSDRIVVMNAGRVEQIGKAEEIYEHPRTEYVAGFIGASNILEGTVLAVNGGRSVVRIGTARVSAIAEGVGPGDRVRLLVRPEKITMRTEDAPEALRGRIESAVYLGESTQWTVSIDGTRALTIVEQNRESKALDRGRIGDTVFITWNAENAVMLKG